METVLVPPYTEIKDITKQKGYVGVMTTEDAEWNLRRCAATVI